MGTFERGVGSLAFSKAVSITGVHRVTVVLEEKSTSNMHDISWFSQDSGQHLSVIDDCNDHMLTVWNWQKKSKIAEIKVNIKLLSHYQSDVELNARPCFYCSLVS